jgi:hypothetical protein
MSAFQRGFNWPTQYEIGDSADGLSALAAPG